MAAFEIQRKATAEEAKKIMKRVEEALKDEERRRKIDYLHPSSHQV